MKVGDVINNHRVLSLYMHEKYNRPYVKLECITCGTIKKTQKSKVKTQGCNHGPCHSRYKDLAGKQYNDLTVLCFVRTNNKINPWRWKCRCKCGNIVIISTGVLNKGQQSCKKCANKKNGDRTRLPDNKSAFNRALRTYKACAKRNMREFELTKKEFMYIINLPCKYCGALPVTDANGAVRNGIDRANNEEGYTKNNCVPCCSRCNKSKHTMSDEEFFEWIKRVYDYSYLKLNDG